MYLNQADLKASPKHNKDASPLRFFPAEGVTVAAIFVLFLLINLATASRFPMVWQDEALYTDPAVNLHLGHGFTSSGWFVQHKSEFWAANVPLHQILLFQWLSCWGFNQVSVRAFNYVVILLATLMLWIAVLRLNLIVAAWSRITLILLVLLSYGVSWDYRSGRPDCIGILLIATAVGVYSIPTIWLRCVSLVGLGIFLPLSGLQVVAYVAIFTCLLVVFLGKSLLREIASLFIGLGIGIIFLYILYTTNQVWDDFLSSVEFARALPNRLQRDPSFFMLSVASLLMAVHQFRRNSLKLRSPLIFGIAASVAVPGLMFMTSRGFPTYYYWMAFIPLAVGVCSELPRLGKLTNTNLLRWYVYGILILTCFVGLPWQLASAAYYWHDRDYSRVEALAERNVKPDDWVYFDYSAYYAVKGKVAAAAEFFGWQLGVMSPQEKAKISLMIIPVEQFDRVTTKLGGHWSDIGDSVTPAQGRSVFFSGRWLAQSYDLHVFRRD